MNFKHKKYLIDNPNKLGKTGDYEPFLWYISNKITNKKFTFITRSSDLRLNFLNISNDEEKIINDAWNFVKFYLDQEKEIDGFIIAINSNSELGSFYTPKPVVQCITDILADIKNNEDQLNQRWQSHKDRPHYPMVIDPACGEGIFLKQAIVQGLTKKQWIFGLDLDPEAVDKWETTNLLQEFEGDRKALRAHFFHQNSLLPIQWSQHRQYYESNINRKYLRNEQFDFVVGNPPYGGLGVYQEMKQLLDTFHPEQPIFEVTVTKLDLFGGEKIEVSKPKKIKNKEILSKEKIKELLDLSKALLKYSVWKDPKNKNAKYDQILSCNGLKINNLDLLNAKETERLKSFPIEVLFLERFIKLAKLPNKNKKGGVIAVIIPDGILSNSTMDYVRQFVSSQTKVLGIISLPRGTFKEAKTNAKTSILLLEKTDGLNISQNYPVFLASIPEIKDEYFVTIKQYFTQFMTHQKNTQYIDETNGLMIRTDKTLKDLNTEKPSSRWDPDFWNPKYELTFGKYLSEPLDKFITSITYGVILTGENRKFKDAGVYYISSTTVIETGINHFLNPLFVGLEDKRNNETKRPEYGDIIMNRSGVGTLGRQCVFTDKLRKYTVSDDTDLIKFKDISPFYVSVFLLTDYGKKQIDRRLRGVSGLIKLSFDDIKAIKIPILSDTIIKNIDEKYLKMTKLHENAMEAKTKGNENEYKENLTKAQELLKDLVAKTEAVIRGEIENVD